MVIYLQLRGNFLEVNRGEHENTYKCGSIFTESHNANEPVSDRTTHYLEQLATTGQWDSLKPVFTLEMSQGFLIVDGNNRRDFAVSHNLTIPKVVVIQNNADLQGSKPQMEVAYGKIQTIDQLFRILSKRVVE